MKDLPLGIYDSYDKENPGRSKDLGMGWWSRKSYKSRVGFDSSTLYEFTSHSYSSYLNSFTNPGDLSKVREVLLSANKLIREILVILDFPFKISICFSTDKFNKFSKSYSSKESSNIRKLFLSTTCLDDEKESDSKKIDVLCGNGVHESAHLRYSELRVFQEFKEHILPNEIQKFIADCPNFKSDGVYKQRLQEFVILLVDLVEDERVENKLLEERPGYSTYILSKKDWDHSHSIIKNVKGFDKPEDIFYNIVRFIRFKSGISEKDIPSEHSKIFEDVYRLVEPIYTDHNVNTKDSCTIGLNLAKLIITTLSLDHSSCSRIINNNNYCSGFYSGVDGDVDNISSKGTMTDLVDTMWLSIFEDVCDGITEFDGETVISHPSKQQLSLAEPEYIKIKTNILPYVPSIRKLLILQNKDYDFVVHGCRSGILDTTKLAEAYQGVPQVYKRTGHVITNKVSICILVDESGSMKRDEKYKTARRAAVLLNEALSGVPGVSLYIYGHSADYVESASKVDPKISSRFSQACYAPLQGSVSLTVYKEPKDRNHCSSFYGLSLISPKYENRDGDAILAAIKRIRKVDSNYCLMFVISDGVPCAIDYDGIPAIEDTKRKIKEAETKFNTSIVGICIDSYNIDEIYSKSIDLSSDLSEFPQKLGKIIKKAILSNRKDNTIIT